MLSAKKEPMINTYVSHSKEGAHEPSVQTTKVEIFGSHYTIRGDVEPQYIADLAAYVNGKMSEVSAQLSSANATKVAILTALNIADEYYQHQALCDQEVANIEKKTDRMIQLLDEGLVGDVYS